MDDMQSEELNFVPEQVEAEVYDAIEAVLKEQTYNDAAVAGWVHDVCAKVTEQLVAANRPYKYMVTCQIMQKNGAGLHTAHSCHWDAAMDNVLVARWPSEKRKDPNARLCCVLTVYGLTM